MKKNLRKAAAETTQTAAERGAEALSDLKEYLTPLAMDAKGKVTPLAHEAKEKIAPLVSEVAERIQPVVKDARGKVEHDVLPKLQGLWNDATNSPAVSEATERGSAVVAALKGNLKVAKQELTRKQKKVAKKMAKAQAKIDRKLARRHKKGRPILKALGVTALVGAAALAIRQFLAPRDDGWTPQQPSAPYQPRNVMTDPPEESTTGTNGTSDDGVPLKDDSSDLTVGDIFGTTDAAAEQSEKRYGEGSYIGPNPPEGYTIKGNERSMKYHTTDSAGYERTVTDVWFNSEEAAVQAGFSRAQR